MAIPRNLGNLASGADTNGVLGVTKGGTGAATLTANNVLLGNGTSALQSVAPGTAGNVLTSNGTAWTSAAGAGGTIQAVASGTLADGSTVIVNADGTVSAVSGVFQTQTVGTPAVFESANSQRPSIVYDSINNKVAIFYVDGGNSFYGTAVVGTISGTSISFGTPVVFKSATTADISAAYESVNGKIVVAYSSSTTSSAFAIVGTVSGTSISFGGEVTVSTINAAATQVVYDPNAAKFLVAFGEDAIGKGALRRFHARVGTVSGTSISFGTKVSNTALQGPITRLGYDPIKQKILASVGAQDGGSFSGLNLMVCTISGTSVSYGTILQVASTASEISPTVFDTAAGQMAVISVANTGGLRIAYATISGTNVSMGGVTVFAAGGTFSSAAYDPIATKVVCAYRDTLLSNTGYIRPLTLAGVVSLGTATQFESGSTTDTACVYDSTAIKVCIAYKDEGNSNFGTSAIFQNSIDTTNLTAENYIGISNASYTNGQTATVQIISSVDDAQTGLTAGQSYYVTRLGALSLTPASPSVFAGTAISATKLIVKG